MHRPDTNNARTALPARRLLPVAGDHPLDRAAVAQQIGLGPYVKRVGLVLKLEPRPVREDPDTVAISEIRVATPAG